MKTVNLYKAQLVTGFMVILLLLLSGCGNRFEEALTNEKKRAKNTLSYLKDQIDRKQLTNILLIDKYADVIASKKPNYRDVALLLKKEATSEGKAYQGLVKRLNEINLQPTSEAMAEANLSEIQLIAIAADETEFNNSLADVVNTLASFSDGELAVVNVPASNRAAAKKTNALGYGMYSMFGNVMGGNRYYYDSWSSRPNYSYYNQYGRNRWGSSYDVNRNYDLSRSNPSKYNKPSSATRARYATSSTRSSRYGSSSSRSASGSSKSSNKSSSRSSTYGSRSSSAYGSSSRSSSSSSSRSYRSGK